MPWSNGVYTRGYPSWTNDAANNLPISATKFDTEDNDFAAGLNNCLTKDGLSTPSAAMTWGLTNAQILALTRGSDGVVFSGGRTGGGNNPTLQISLADATGIALNLTTAQQIAMAIQGTNIVALTSSSIALAIGGTTALSINSSRTTTLSGGGSAAALVVAAAGSGQATQIDGTAVNGVYSTWTISGTAVLDLGSRKQVTGSGSASDGAIDVRGNNTFAIATNATERLTINGSGNWVIGPASAAPLLTLAETSGVVTTLVLGAAGGFATAIKLLGASGAQGSNFLIGNQNNVSNALEFTPSTAAGGSTFTTPAAEILGTGEFFVNEPNANSQTGTYHQIGYLDTPPRAITANVTLALTDRGKSIYISGTTAGQTLTIPANASVAFPTTATIIIVNRSNQNWLVAITTDVLTWLPSLATGTRTLAAGGVMTLYKETSTGWVAWGFGIT